MDTRKNPLDTKTTNIASTKPPVQENELPLEDDLVEYDTFSSLSTTTAGAAEQPDPKKILQLQRVMGNRYVVNNIPPQLQHPSNAANNLLNLKMAEPSTEAAPQINVEPSSDIQRKLSYTTGDLEKAKLSGGFAHTRQLYNAVRFYHQGYKEDVATQTRLLDQITEKGQQFLVKEDETMKSNPWMKDDYDIRTGTVKKLLQMTETERRNIRVSAKSGGITGLELDVTYTVSDTVADGLQVIQVWWGNKSTLGIGVGKNNFEDDGKQYESFVDGGMNSPFVTLSGEQPAHASKPYYLTSDEVDSQVAWDKKAKSGTVQIYDEPTASVHFDEMNFETAVVAINYNGSGKDRVMQVFTWGFTTQGTKQMHEKGDEIAGKPSGVKTTGSVSSKFQSIVANDYPDYEYD